MERNVEGNSSTINKLKEVNPKVGWRQVID